jgi:hypothetical protein
MLPEFFAGAIGFCAPAGNGNACGMSGPAQMHDYTK